MKQDQSLKKNKNFKKLKGANTLGLSKESNSKLKTKASNETLVTQRLPVCTNS